MRDTYHRQQERLSVLNLEILILELLAVDGFSTGAIPLRKISTLDHEAFK